MIRPFLEKMTRSELLAVMTGGFATVSGALLGTYVTLGVSTYRGSHNVITTGFAAVASSMLGTSQSG